MNNHPHNLSPNQQLHLEALRNCLHDLEEAIASLLQLTRSLPQGTLRDLRLDRVSEFDSIGDVMRQVLDAIWSAVGFRGHFENLA